MNGRGIPRPSFFETLLQTLLVSLDHLLDHLAADAACLAGGQVTVVAVGQIDADLGSGLHLELVHGLTGLGHIDLIVALHTVSLLSFILGKIIASREKRFSFRTHIFAQNEPDIPAIFRKST